MERLKGKPSEDPSQGELVTRADGTQAIRVRKRKRRSEQPLREEAKRVRRTRAIQVGGVLVTLIVLTLVIGAAFVYTNTAPFRKNLSEAISKRLGADIEFRLFRVTPVSANADAINLTWKDGGFLKDAKLRGVTAKISPATILGRSIKGDELIAREGDITLQAPGQGAPKTAVDDTAMPVAFGRVVVSKLNVAFGTPPETAFRIVGSEGSLTSAENKSLKTLNLHRGSLSIGKWPTLKIERSLIDIQPTEIGISSIRLADSLATPNGDMELSGSINTMDPSAISTLSVKAEAFNLADLLGPEIAKILSLRIDSRQVTDSNYLAFRAGDPSDAELSIAFANALCATSRLANLRFLPFIAKHLNDKDYVAPEFDEVTGIIRRKNGKVELAELNFLRKTFMAVRGDIAIAADKSLSGKLEVGLPDSVIHLSGDPKIDILFGPSANGFRWITIQLEGTLADPSDDITRQFDAVKADAPPAPNPAAPAPSEANDPAVPADPGKVFEEQTTPRER